MDDLSWYYTYPEPYPNPQPEYMGRMEDHVQWHIHNVDGLLRQLICLTIDSVVLNTSHNVNFNRVAVGPTASSIIVPENLLRKKVIVHNDSGGILYIKLGSNDTTSDSFTYRLTPNTGQEITNYTGMIAGIKGSGNSFALITELY